MFDLDKAINTWSASVHPYGFNKKARIDELNDHLYCEIERLQKQGLSVEQAFLAATEQVGRVVDLAAEHSKNRNSFFRLFDDVPGFIFNDQQHGDNDMDKKRAAVLNIAVSIFFAIAILLSSYMLGDSPASETVMFILIAVWWVPFSYLTARGAGNTMSIKSEFLCIKRRLTNLFNPS